MSFFMPTPSKKTAARFDADPNLAALFGSYDDQPDHPGVVSRFRNLLHHYVHQQGDFHETARPVPTFWTGCGAIRREVFLELGGFDPERYHRPAIEDIELGYRLNRAGRWVHLVRDIQASHLKRWTLWSVVRTDIFQRGVPWTLLMLRSGDAESDLNVSRSQRICVALTGLTVVSTSTAIVEPRMLLLSSLLIAANVAINHRFHWFLAKRRDWKLSPAAIFLHQLYYICCGVSVVVALSIWFAGGGKRAAAEANIHRRVRSIPPKDQARRERESPREGGVTMDSKLKVAVVRDPQRRAAVAQALALVADDLRGNLPARLAQTELRQSSTTKSVHSS